MDNYGIKKAALGIRYLLKYLETGKEENFNIVLDCLNEIELWCLITSYCNNIDELFDIVPDFVLDNIFNECIPEGLTKEEAYGNGFYTEYTLTSKEQFKKIRGLLSHGKFTNSNGIITVLDKDYKATFDIIWLERLTSVTLGNERLGLKKGMNEVSILSLVNKPQITIEEFKKFIEDGTIQFYKVTALSGNKEAIVDSMPYKVINSSELTFETMFQTAISIMRNNTLSVFNSLEENKIELKNTLKK